MVANNENLVPFNKRTVSEQRKIQSAGGKASGEARRRKADFRKTLNLLLTAEINNEEWTPVLEALGLDSTLESAVNAAMIKEALSGNVKAYEAIARFAGQSERTDADIEEQKIRTDRARRAKEQEIGDTDSAEENIKDFLKAMKPTQEDMDSLFESEEEDDEEKEETEEI